jgi:hypothetical protein|tara:strand:+ start:484 stop:684 length:201 start_codon:yes stop_codon:yes gene_type:complete
MNIKIREARNEVSKAAMSMIKPHLKSPLNRGGKKPKNNIVHEKPTGTSLVISNSGCLRFSVEKAMT